MDRELHGDLRDLIARTPGDAVTVGPQDTLLTAYNRMRQADVSQLPVLDDGRLIGLVDESVWFNAREPIAQTFVKDGDRFTVIANHFKSKS